MEDEVKMSPVDATKYRACVAFLNFLATDRPDIQFPTKECAKKISSPAIGDWELFKHLLKYLKGKPRARQWFEWRNGHAKVLKGYSDSDWAGCRVSRKSTTGGCLTWNGHLVKSWCRNQSTVATSSGEAELYAATKCGSELLGLKSFAADLGLKVEFQLNAGANATIGMLNRIGLGKMRHVEVCDLWMQGVVRGRRIDLRKVSGVKNPADMMTKYLLAYDVNCYMGSLGFEFG